jgi:lipopolysaccharide biosynthesis glycosyltransferase
MSLAMTQPSVIHIAIYLDEGYAVPATVLVRSMLDNLGPSPAVHLHVLGLGLRDTTKRTMATSWPADRVVVHWVDVDWRDYEGVYLPTGYLSSAAYARLLIDRYLPADVEKVLTIDSDGIVLGDIAELWRLAPRRSCLMAVRDSFVRTLSDDTSEFIQRGCNTPDAPYFNSGLMLIDTKRWRDLGVAQRCFELASRHPGKAVIGDNSLLNAVLAGDWEPLPLRWNCNTRHLAIHSYPSIRGHVHAPAEVADALRHPGFLHFVSGRKPWDARWYHPDGEIYRRSVAQTEWRDQHLAVTGRQWRWDATAFSWLCYRQAAETRGRWRISGKRTVDLVHFMKRLVTDGQ